MGWFTDYGKYTERDFPRWSFEVPRCQAEQTKWRDDHNFGFHVSDVDGDRYTQTNMPTKTSIVAT